MDDLFVTVEVPKMRTYRIMGVRENGGTTELDTLECIRRPTKNEMRQQYREALGKGTFKDVLIIKVSELTDVYKVKASVIREHGAYRKTKGGER